MWKYSNQIKIRWVSFILGIVALVTLFLCYKNDIPTSQTGLKVFFTRLQINFEILPVWWYIVVIFSNIFLMLIGVPSVFLALPLILLKGCTFAFVVTAFCQINSTLIAMWISYKLSISKIPRELIEKLQKNKDNFQKFAFWSRLYYNIPLRTIDNLTPLIHDSSEAFYSSLIAASSAIMIRICIPILLIKYTFAQFTVLEPNPSLEQSRLLIWAIILITYTVLPKVPELMICPKNVKNVLLEIETPS